MFARRVEKKGVIVDLFWIPAHVGIEGNEKADTMAKKGSDNVLVTNVDIPVSDLFSKFKMRCKEKNFEMLKRMSSEKGSFYFNNFCYPSNKPWFVMIKTHRKVISNINRIRSGHTKAKKHLARFNIVDNEICDCGLFEETVEHVFWQCVKYEVERKTMLKKLRKLKFFSPYSIVPLLYKINQNLIDILTEFILKCDIKL